MDCTVQTLLRDHFADYCRHKTLPPHHYHAANKMMCCRTAVLGGHVQRCPDNHVSGIWYNSCKHRSCPQCNNIQIERWLQKQKNRLINTAHYHVIFTLPHELNIFWLHHPNTLTQLFFKCVKETLLTLTQDPLFLGAMPGFICALHTWGRSLSLHPHIHCLITAGGLDQANHWKTNKKNIFIPVRVLRQMFMKKYLAELFCLLKTHRLSLPKGTDEPRIKPLYKKKWNIKVEPCYAHGNGLVTYLARYVRGGPINNTQLHAISESKIRLRYLEHATGKTTSIDYPASRLIQLLLIHVPDKRKKVVRSYGLYASCKQSQLNIARQHWQQAPVLEDDFLTWQDYMQRLPKENTVYLCPVCGKKLIAAETIMPIRAPPKKQILRI